jgi:hypothetical protein
VIGSSQEPRLQIARGDLVAAALAGSWRCGPVPFGLSPAALAEVTPLLLGGGGASLGWWRVRHSSLSSSREATELRQAYRHYSLQSALQEHRLQEALGALREAGIHPLLAKGWAVARLYPEPGLRPYGDIDLCVLPEQRAAARAALGNLESHIDAVDLHPGLGWCRNGQAFSLMDDRRLDELYARSQSALVRDQEVRVLGAEDHLRLLCLHFLSHGAWRPLWLCDIGAALETRPPDFDWDLCLSGDQRRTGWVDCAISLAHQLLGARLDDTPAAVRTYRLPRWVAPAVLRQWGQIYRHRAPMSYFLRHPVMGLRELPHHWPNGIEATVDVRGPLNDWPRLPFQVAACVSRLAGFVWGLPGRQA